MHMRRIATTMVAAIAVVSLSGCGGGGSSSGSASPGTSGDTDAYGAFTLADSQGQTNARRETRNGNGRTEISGTISGLTDEGYQLLFSTDDGDNVLADIGADGTFTAQLDLSRPYRIALLRDGQFVTALYAAQRTGTAVPLVLSFQDSTLTILSGNISTTGTALRTDASGIPVGMAAGLEMPGLTDEAQTPTQQTTSMDADLDGVPDLFDADKDGDGTIDAVDSQVLAAVPALTTGFFVSGINVFTNLKLDIDEVGTPASLFPHNNQVVVTIEWIENPAETPTGHAVQGVEIVTLPNWTAYGFSTAVTDWSELGGGAWNGSLTFDVDRWEAFVSSPRADATLAAAYPNYVTQNESVPLNFNLSTSTTRPNLYVLRITYVDTVSGATTTRFSFAVTHYTYRTPPLPEVVTTDIGVHTIVRSDVNGDGHRANPIDYPNTGDVLIVGMPPKFHSGSATVMWGTMTWSGHLFYYDATGAQIGGLNSGRATITSTPASHPQITIPQADLVSATTTTDMNGDGTSDFDAGKDSDDIVAYKIDYTADTALGGARGNSGMFLYLVRQGQASPF